MKQSFNAYAEADEKGIAGNACNDTVLHMKLQSIIYESKATFFEGLRHITFFSGRFLWMLVILAFSGCSDYLNLVPDDGLATLDNAFATRAESKRYLYTCYSYMPREGDPSQNPALLGGDEFWVPTDIPENTQISLTMLNISRGFQSAINPIGGFHWAQLYQGLRVCNIFLENIETVPDLEEWERIQWIAEVTFLKAYYHFYLVRMYGPIPLIKENLSINASPDQVKVTRDPVDECFDYIVELLDKAIPDLLPEVLAPEDELGRITMPIAAALKAKVLVTAASPLFNGNHDQATLANRDGTKLFNPDVVAEKWEKAVAACREAIQICHDAKIHLYQYTPAAGEVLSDTLKLELTLRNTVSQKWNREIIWGDSQTSGTANRLVQSQSMPIFGTYNNSVISSQLQPPVKMAEMYHTNHGVPIAEDKYWEASDLYAFHPLWTDAEKYYIIKDYTTIEMHFNREPRFYACLGFDGGIWYGQGKYGNDPFSLFSVACRADGAQTKQTSFQGPFTGYWPKKLVWYQNMVTGIDNYSGFSYTRYPWPVMRLSDLYLLYAEALNEAEGPNGPNSGELFYYIDEVRRKAGLEGVKYSYDNYTNSQKYTIQTGLRQIIHRERLIELAFEGHRFWDLRRWKEAPDEYRTPMEAYSVTKAAPEEFYKRQIVNKLTFSLKNYFWPIQNSLIEQNPKLVQNIGW
jgi:hypothetical protein